MSMIDDIKRDREAGRGNQWRLLETMSSATVMDGTCEVLSYVELESKANRANARRIARVPDMEAALIEAVEALQMVGAIIHNGDDPDGSGFFDITAAQIEQVFAAIARATGADT